MYKVVYEKETGNLIEIVPYDGLLLQDNEIVVFEIPKYNGLVQGLKVEDKKLIVFDFPMSREEKKYQIMNFDLLPRIKELKQKLSDTDYQILKYVEGAISNEEFFAIRNIRKKLRDEINILENQILNL